jgi:hypothetical protein
MTLATGCSQIFTNGGTLSTYNDTISLNHECSVGILNFYSFSLVSSTGTGSLSPSQIASEIELTPCNGVNSDEVCVTDPTSLSGGFELSAAPGSNPFFAQGQTVSYTIDWKFVIDSGPEATGADLGLDPPVPDVSVSQTYCLSAPNPTFSELDTTQCTPHTLLVGTPPLSLTSSASFGNPDPSLTLGDVQTVITLTGGPNGASFNAVTGTATIVETPEPSVFLLGASGLLLLGTLRKRAARV